MIVSHLAAMTNNRVIGVNNGLPWSLPEDMKFFKEKTTGHIMIMGRKTFEGLPGILPKRLHIVITRQKDYKAEHERVIIVESLEKALEEAKKHTAQWGDEVFVIGGGEIFTQSLPYTNRIYLTVIEKEFPGDAYFPEFDTNTFKLVEKKDRAEPFPFSFRIYERA